MIMQKLLLSIVTLSALTTAAHAQDVAAGQTGFALCGVCHAVGERAQNKLGPVLNGLEGRRAGIAAGYDYSPVMKSANIPWSEATFKDFMANPSGKVLRLHNLPAQDATLETGLQVAMLEAC